MIRSLFWVCLVAVTMLALWPADQFAILSSLWDKAQHALAYWVLGVLGALSYWKSQYVVFVALATHGALIEIIQGLSQMRIASLEDWLADLLGLLLACGVVCWARRKPVLRDCFADRRQHSDTSEN